MNERCYELMVKTLPRLLPAVCLISFLVFDAIWISILVATCCFAYIYLVQVFVERSQSLYGSPYLLVTLTCAALTWIEYNYRILQGFLN